MTSGIRPRRSRLPPSEFSLHTEASIGTCIVRALSLSAFAFLRKVENENGYYFRPFSDRELVGEPPGYIDRILLGHYFTSPFPRGLGGGTSTDEGNFSCARTTLFSTTAIPRKRPIIEGRLPP